MKTVEELNVGDTPIIQRFSLDPYPTLDANWIGTKKIIHTSTNEIAVDEKPMEKASEDDFEFFLGTFDPADTATLKPNNEYKLVYEIKNEVIVPKFKRTIIFNILAKEDYISN